MRFPRALTVALVASIAVLGLTACTVGADPSPSPTKSSASPSSRPSPSPTSDLPSDVLFQITADLVSTGDTHVLVTETAYAPVSEPAGARDVLTAPAAGCVDGENGDLDGDQWVKVQVTSTVEGSPVDDDHFLLIYSSGENTPTGFSGDWKSLESGCNDGRLATPGTATGFTVFDSPTGWVNARWGADVVTSLTSSEGSYDINGCRLAIGPAAAGVDLPDAWKSIDSEMGCSYGAPTK